MPSDPANTLHCDHGRRRQAIVESVLADVFQRRLTAGQHLVTQDLAERFGVSHTPVREALIVLEAMGVLSHGNVRVSLHRGTSPEEVERFLAVLPEVVARIRKEAGL